ncbi:hypothetical protein Psi02_64230 [Planotetraspora silvatica]|uniref:Uncharacterized protein n=1 Tax=Planotetraspora silvatica TaxID=234614 RepID=A0A8J3XR37_9ACTN|nr:hypothetical protein [Planotetraspora silvatica]GII49999.1 hypothetical protein Psi02_64230 [Planotetraspora silvatica]
MADYDIPSDLLDLQRAYFAADQRVQESGEGFPSAIDIANQEAEISDEQRSALIEARAARLDLVSELYRHPWFDTVDNTHEARMALRKAARATG